MADSPRSFLFILGSSRTGGNTETLVRTAAEHLEPGAAQQWLRLTDLDLPPFRDLRHLGDGRTPPPKAPSASSRTPPSPPPTSSSPPRSTGTP
jgi:NAD(P)H-dependent FMN reductase